MTKFSYKTNILALCTIGIFAFFAPSFSYATSNGNTEEEAPPPLTQAEIEQIVRQNEPGTFGVNNFLNSLTEADRADFLGNIENIYPDGLTDQALTNDFFDIHDLPVDPPITLEDIPRGDHDGPVAPIEPFAAPCGSTCGGCRCGTPIRRNHLNIQQENSALFQEYRIWMIDTFFRQHLGYAMAAMTQQMTVVGLQATKVIGTFFDAKHQLETQRLFQTLMAGAHKDYQPSEGVCDIGTNARGLAASERKSNLAQQTLANRIMARQLMSNGNLTTFPIQNSDLKSRIHSFKTRFCKKDDNGGNLKNLCAGVTAPKQTINKDVDYTRTVDSVLTVDLDFSKDSALNSSDLTPDEASAFALMANLFANTPMPSIGGDVLADNLGNPREASYKYLDLRAVAAKRSVAQNSISAIIAEKASGEKNIEYAPFLKSAIEELGVEDILNQNGGIAVSVEDQIDFLVGKNPSYFAQMEVLTKKLYQNPNFFTELYDKPVNVIRKRAAIRAIGLMQDRDFYNSLLRSEAVLSVALEAMLSEEHDRVYRNLQKLGPDNEEAAP